MKAVIFNSGLGKRMEEMTIDKPKSMVKLKNGETIFERQIRILSECGIKEFVVTTGPFKEMLENVANNDVFRDLKFTFVQNSIYDKTNCIYSMSLITDIIKNDDIICLHGDLVFDYKLIEDILKDNRKNLCLINEYLDLPEKDFKGRIIEGKLDEISVDIFDNNCFAFQPLYKLSSNIVNKWCDKVNEFVSNGIVNVYAENALNEIMNEILIEPFSYSSYYIDEIDNKSDYERVSNIIINFDYKEQKILKKKDLISNLEKINSKDILLVIDKIFLDNEFVKKLINSKYNIHIFSNFSPNPKYEEVLKAIDICEKNNCNLIISIGGGSAIDIGKCVKILAHQNDKTMFLKNQYNYSYIKQIAIPTTAGTGSESTKFAVLYYKGLKYSLMTECLLPDYVLLNEDFINTLPIYQKKCTLLDALCQSIESIWSKNATSESIEYATKSIKLIFDNYKEYIYNSNDKININMLLASNYSGKAINISQTTSAHALSYKITSEFNIPHGHAVAMCMNVIWKYMIDISKNNIYLEEKLLLLARCMEVNDIDESYDKYLNLFNFLELDDFIESNVDYIDEFVNLVNIQRLNNNPVNFNKNDIKNIYKKILRKIN